MRVVIDIEANGLENPTQIWCIVCKDIDTGIVYRFRGDYEDFKVFAGQVSTWIGHNALGYDIPVLCNILGMVVSTSFRNVIDTLIISKLVNYSRPSGHSLEAYGEEFNFPKGKNHYLDFFKKWSQELEDYCVQDVQLTERVYRSYSNVINNPNWASAINLEHEFQWIVNSLHSRGFSFNSVRAQALLDKVTVELDDLDKEIENAFPSRLRPIREIVPRLTKYGTLNKTDFRWVSSGDLSEYNGGPFCRCSWERFNPSSHKQIIGVLSAAGWCPTDKTKTHQETEREVNRAKYTPKHYLSVDLDILYGKLDILRKFGWKINEANLSTLPSTAPSPARTLAKRILLESRRRTLTEWLGLVQENNRIHGKFYGIGAWTHRMAHQQPNTANIPNEFKEDGTKKLLGKELRALWQAPKNRLLVGVDAEGIQLRIFAHYVDDKELTESLVNGSKANKTDPHSLNQRVLGSICRTRQAAKRFLYALLLGGGVGKFAEILGCTKEEATEAVNKFNKRYPGFDFLKRERFPSDAQAGYFIGLDGRKVLIPGNTLGDRRHLCMSGYLQNGEAIIIKRAAIISYPLIGRLESWFVDIVHDEIQSETPNDMRIALQVAKIKADAIAAAGEYYKLKCPLAGSYYNDDKRDYTIGTNWATTH